MFTDYLQPLTQWLHSHPNSALLFTFLISFSESLAIIGSIIPGTLTMTAIGILAGSGVMRVDLTIAVACLGALAGDGASYAIGRHFSDRIAQVWPFSRYPNLLRHGKDFFIQHGGKSVFIGRFVGPLRPVIPVIAGMMHMSRLQFFIVNFLSAIAWGFVYLMPGYLIGTAGNQLSTESARRLFGFIIGLLLFTWIAGKGIHWLLRTMNRWYSAHLKTICAWSVKHPYFGSFFQSMLNSKDDGRFIISLIFVWLLCLLFTILISVLVLQNTCVTLVNQPIAYFLQSLRTPLFDGFFILISFIISPLCLFGIFLVVTLAALYRRDYRLFRFWVSLAVITIGFTWVLASNVIIPNPFNFCKSKLNSSFPVISLTCATALFSFMICYLLTQSRNELSLLLRALLSTILVLAGFSTIYLGDNWVTSVIGAYFIGLTISLIHWIFYQRRAVSHHRLGAIVVLSTLIVCLSTYLEYTKHFKIEMDNHRLQHKQYQLSEKIWWEQDEPLLPIYTQNRMGKNIGIFNIQYVGSIDHLRARLKHSGWNQQSSSFLYALLIRFGEQNSPEKLPFMEQLYLNKKPVLIMTYTMSNKNVYILRLWKSNYLLKNHQEPIWLGSIIVTHKKNHDNHQVDIQALNQEVFTPILPAIKHYRVTSMPVKNAHLTSLRYVIPPELLIIKDQIE